MSPKSNTTAPAANKGKFGFTFEKVASVPEKAAGQARYDWASFPAPVIVEGKEPEITRAFIAGANPKTISTSIKAFQEKVAAKSEPVPEFKIVREKDDKGEVTGVWVYRTE